MIIQVTTDQKMCAELLDAMGLTGKVDPSPGRKYCVGFTAYPSINAHVIVENREGVYCCHVLQECTKEEAKGYFDGVLKQVRIVGKPRLVLSDPGTGKPNDETLN